MADIEVREILSRVYGVRGLPFPGKPREEAASQFSLPGQPNIGIGNPIAAGFNYTGSAPKTQSRIGSPLFAQNMLGMWVFLPAKLGGVELPNPLISITGSKRIIEEDVIEVGTVTEKVFTQPFDITIICTLLNNDQTWPEEQLIEINKLWKRDEVLKLECALTDIFLQEDRNFILQGIDVLDMAGVEDAQVVQLTGRSNVDFVLEIK